MVLVNKYPSSSNRSRAANTEFLEIDIISAKARLEGNFVQQLAFHLKIASRKAVYNPSLIWPFGKIKWGKDAEIEAAISKLVL